MDNLGDWLYIVILIAIGISSIFSSAKKKRQAAQAPHPPVPETGNKGGDMPKPKGFWELLEEMQGGGQAQEEAPRPTPQPIVITEKKKKTQEQRRKTQPTMLSSAYGSEGTSVFKETPAGQSLDLINLSEEEAFALPADSFRTADELKKAIIYSEILNRRY
jgi:hypothetical protein